MAQPQDGAEFEARSEESWPPADPLAQGGDPEGVPARGGRPLLAAALVLLTLAWLAACALALYRAMPPPTMINLVSWTATISVPVVLFGLVWLIFGRTGRLETERFTRAVAEMRGEAESLDRVLAAVAERIASNRAQLSDESARLMKLGEEASDRLGRVTHFLARESGELERQSGALESAAAQARIDMGVLLADLPHAESAARSFSETLREAGVTAHERSRALEAQLSAIAARAQDADISTGGAAERLSAHIARIETSAGVAADQLDQARARLDAAVDGALTRTTEAVEATRGALDAQAQGLLANVDQGRARLTEAGAEAGRELAQRLDAARQQVLAAGEQAAAQVAERLGAAQQLFASAGAAASGQIGAQLDEAQRLVAAIGAGIAAQEEAGRALVETLDRDLAGLDERLAALGARTDAQSTQMGAALASLRDSTATLRQEVDAGTREAAALAGRAQAMGGALDAVTSRLRDELPPALTEVEERAAAARETALSLAEPVEAARVAAAEGAARLAEAEASVARQREALEALLAGIAEAVGGVEDKLRGLSEAVNGADDSASLLVRETGPELVEALVRVREAARVAATHAREAICAVIPESAATLAEAVREAVDASVTDSVREQIAGLDAAAQHAALAARKASERLTRQLLSLGDGAAALERKIDEEKALREEHERGSMSRRVALLIESLNSTAIDVTKILSNDVTDTAWSAYLKGDRGVFTRRAVRLLETGEAREIARHYEEEPEFREQVNRYIHDFEAMLRRVLSDGEGDALSVALLSSDMGKLYVALAQAIDRLRR